MVTGRKDPGSGRRSIAWEEKVVFFSFFKPLEWKDLVWKGQRSKL